ncbi:MAG: hypothetical protein M1823_008074, partial [Watsoniomyces obsoletus]
MAPGVPFSDCFDSRLERVIALALRDGSGAFVNSFNYVRCRGDFLFKPVTWKRTYGLGHPNHHPEKSRKALRKQLATRSDFEDTAGKRPNIARFGPLPAEVEFWSRVAEIVAKVFGFCGPIQHHSFSHVDQRNLLQQE